MQNQHTRELICARKTSHENNNKEDEPVVEFMSFVFTGMPGKSYRRRLRSLLLCLCDVFLAQINSIVCWFSLYRVDRSRYKKYKSLYKKSLEQADQESLRGKLWELEETLDVTNILIARQQARLEVSFSFLYYTVIVLDVFRNWCDIYKCSSSSIDSCMSWLRLVTLIDWPVSPWTGQTVRHGETGQTVSVTSQDIQLSVLQKVVHGEAGQIVSVTSQDIQPSVLLLELCRTHTHTHIHTHTHRHTHMHTHTPCHTLSLSLFFSSVLH